MWASAGVSVPQTPICIYPHRSVVKLPGSKVMGIIPERRLFNAGICLGFEGCVDSFPHKFSAAWQLVFSCSLRMG